ncbi:MAG: peptide-N-glycosidase F-related protein [Chitinophagales bacterium]|nr:peptide-N-glycosidase F-related protein [Chitinophagales bacterium]
MNKFVLLACISIFLINKSQAATGDTTVVVAHSLSNLASPPSNDDEWVVFPNNGTTYQRIIMQFTLGCGTPNCSGWDYTVNASLGKKTGLLDSTVTAIDTLTSDTTWNVFEQMEYIEVGRLITPYGTYMASGSQGFDNSWTHPYYYDVTDYAQFLKDSTSVRVRYDGWTDAFSARVEFIFIEGAPTRTVSNVIEVYDTYIGYGNSAGFESVATQKSYIISPSVTSAKVLVLMTGHGNQGEFDPHSFYLKVNGNQVYSRLLWKDDCDINPIAPQGGTWIFHRANWCPGEKVPVYEIDITPYITPGQIATIDLDFDDFTIGSGNSAGYGTSVHLITYTSENANDVMLEEIIAPNSDKPYLHHNPICTQPIVKIKNMGKQNLTYAEISYWVKGGSKWYYEWTGNLAPFHSDTIMLPVFDWNSTDSLNTTFIAEANWPNNVPDEYVFSNHLESQFISTPELDSAFVIFFRSNNQPWENWYLVRNEQGDTIRYENTFAAATSYYDTLRLTPGSYSFDFFDFDSLNWGAGDGLRFFVNQPPNASASDPWYETTGQVAFRKATSGFLKSFNADFGHHIHYEFTVGYALGDNPSKIPPEPPVHPTAVNELAVAATMNVFPNPASDVLNVRIDLSKPMKGKILLSDISGKTVKQFDYNALGDSFSISTKELSKGMYFLSLISEGVRVDRKVIIQ